MNQPGPLVDISDLGEFSVPIVICDVRWYLDGRSGSDAYQAGHIPGSIFVDLEVHLTGPASGESGRHPFPDPTDFAAALGGLGIGPNDPVVAYDDAGGMVAGRLVWMLRILGHPASLLNGGLGVWPGPLATGEVFRPPVECPVRFWPDSRIVDIDEVAGWADQRILLDARAGERYRGDAEPVDPRPGHIPGAVNAPFVGNLDPTGRFLPKGQLRDRYASLGVVDADGVTVYCGSGVSACHDLLAMEHAGLGRGSLYPGSWSQWSTTNRPVATGPDPERIRQA
ncbi:MAG: sulfurtransferase [Actinomycetota bacterium]|nr:sulfurtransferase [Actinomycetota bacterium]